MAETQRHTPGGSEAARMKIFEVFMIVQCTCTSPKHYHHTTETAAAFQDRVYGFGNRVANLGGKNRAVCTVCKAEHRVGGDEAIAQKKAK